MGGGGGEGSWGSQEPPPLHKVKNGNVNSSFRMTNHTFQVASRQN